MRSLLKSQRAPKSEAGGGFRNSSSRPEETQRQNYLPKVAQHIGCKGRVRPRALGSLVLLCVLWSPRPIQHKC